MKPLSLEITPHDAKAFDALAHWLPPETELFVANLPDHDPELLIEACARVRTAGYRPVPHLVARNIEGPPALRRLLSRLTAEAQVDCAFVLGGDRGVPAGPFADALDLLGTGLLPEHGIRSIALACFPEGHPRIVAASLQRALVAKLAAADRDGLAVLLVSQFLFDDRPLLGYTRGLRALGIEAPLRVGLAGPADAETLSTFASELGVGASKRVVEAQAAEPGGVRTDQSPRRLMLSIAGAQAADPSLGIEGFHLFPFGDTAETAAWAAHHRL